MRRRVAEPRVHEVGEIAFEDRSCVGGGVFGVGLMAGGDERCAQPDESRYRAGVVVTQPRNTGLVFATRDLGPRGVVGVGGGDNRQGGRSEAPEGSRRVACAAKGFDLGAQSLFGASHPGPNVGGQKALVRLTRALRPGQSSVKSGGSPRLT
jgi:hypothetical protein